MDEALLAVAATVLALAGIREGEVVADLVCGTGWLTHPAVAAAGPAGRVFGVDADPASLALARDRRASAVLWIQGDVTRLPFGPGTVDKILCGPTGSGLAAVLADVARVLVPGGRVVVSSWAETDLPGLLRAAGLRVVHTTDHYATATTPHT